MTVRSLSRDYFSRWGAPKVRAVDPRIFSLRTFAECMKCGFCRDQCCSYGADVDMAAVARLVALGPDFERFVGMPAEQWFDGRVVCDGEFPTGAQTRFRAAAGACVFLDRASRGCRIHAYCLAHGLDYHQYKSCVCFLFPLTFENGVLMPSAELIDGTLACAGAGEILFDAARGEIAALWGKALVEELEGLR
jgi:hypothetical protein